MMNGRDNDPNSADSLFDQFVSACTCKTILNTFQELCSVLGLTNADHTTFYKQLKSRLTSWKAMSLWSKLDKRASHRDYQKMQACSNTKVSKSLPRSMVRAFAHGAVGHWIDPSWGGPIELFLVPASASQLV